MVVVKSKLVCLSFLILTNLVSVLQEICLYSYRFVLFWLKAGNVSFADTNPCILVTMLFLWEVCFILVKWCWYYCWNELYTSLLRDSHVIFEVFIVVHFILWASGLWLNVVRWVPTNALEAAGSFAILLITNKLIWCDIAEDCNWNLTYFSRWMFWYFFVTFIIDRIPCIALHLLFMLQGFFCIFLAVKMMIHQQERLSSYCMRELSGNVELHYRDWEKRILT
jgi:hypothetical protein